MDQGLSQEMTARAKKKRAQILDGARAVFLAEGFDGASMEAIAHAAGVSKGTLYTYFKGKDELFTSLVAAYQNRSLEEIFRGLNKAAELRENLETLGAELSRQGARAGEPRVTESGRRGVREVP
jgi:AcrR family transcriptional regulator